MAGRAASGACAAASSSRSFVGKTAPHAVFRSSSLWMPFAVVPEARLRRDVPEARLRRDDPEPGQMRADPCSRSGSAGG